MCDLFLDSFSNLFSLIFYCKLWLFLLLNMQNNENTYEEADREERKKHKKNIFNSKNEFGKWPFIYDVCNKA